MCKEGEKKVTWWMELNPSIDLNFFFIFSSFPLVIRHLVYFNLSFFSGVPSSFWVMKTLSSIDFDDLFSFSMRQRWNQKNTEKKGEAAARKHGIKYKSMEINLNKCEIVHCFVPSVCCCWLCPNTISGPLWNSSDKNALTILFECCRKSCFGSLFISTQLAFG